MQKALVSLRAAMAKNNIDATLISDGANRMYFSGFKGSSGTVLVTADDSVFMTDSRYTLQAKCQCSDFRIMEISGKKLFDFISCYFKENNIKSVWIDGDVISYSEYKNIEAVSSGIIFKNGSNTFLEIRAVKSEAEAEILKQAALISDKAMQKALDSFTVGITEHELAVMFEKNALDLGARLSFIIVASGENAALPHHEPSERVINYGDIVTIDYGVIYKGYHSDCTRTFAVGDIPDELKKIHNIVKTAQYKAVNAIKPGASCRELDKLARDIITEAGYGENFGHSLGHGVGLEIHEEPRLSKAANTILKPGMFVTVEPGIYIEGLGGVRIEDTLMVTENGAVSITEMIPKCLKIKEL